MSASKMRKIQNIFLVINLSGKINTLAFVSFKMLRSASSYNILF